MGVVPWPWVQVVPSERAAAHEEINFSFVDQAIRIGMLNFPAKFEKITLVLVDYGLIAERDPHLHTHAHQDTHDLSKPTHKSTPKGAHKLPTPTHHHPDLKFSQAIFPLFLVNF